MLKTSTTNCNPHIPHRPREKEMDSKLIDHNQKICLIESSCLIGKKEDGVLVWLKIQESFRSYITKTQTTVRTRNGKKTAVGQNFSLGGEDPSNLINRQKDRLL